MKHNRKNSRKLGRNEGELEKKKRNVQIKRQKNTKKMIQNFLDWDLPENTKQLKQNP